MAETVEEPVVVGGTYKWQITASKDGTTWDITGGTVSVYFTDPSGNVSGPFSCTIPTGTDGKAYYVNLTTLIDEAGAWKYRFKLSVSGVVQFTTHYTFIAEPGE